MPKSLASTPIILAKIPSTISINKLKLVKSISLSAPSCSPKGLIYLNSPLLVLFRLTAVLVYRITPQKKEVSIYSPKSSAVLAVAI